MGGNVLFLRPLLSSLLCFDEDRLNFSSESNPYSSLQLARFEPQPTLSSEVYSP